MIRLRRRSPAAPDLRIFPRPDAPNTPERKDEDPFVIGARIEGSEKRAAASGRSRIGLCAGIFVCAYAVLGLRLADVALMRGPAPDSLVETQAAAAAAAPRAEFVDRNGELLAANLPVVSLEVDGKYVWDAREAAEALATVLPDLDVEGLERKLNKKLYVVVEKTLSPGRQKAVFELGVPGVRFRPHEMRLYPRGGAGAHVIGHVDADGRGVMGMERWLESADATGPVALSIDLRAQQAMEEELARSLARFQAQAGWGVALDVTTGEVIALASAPSFDPNRYGAAPADARRNRAAYDQYELGSALKTATVALALETGAAALTDTFDARKPLKIGGHTIRDFHPEKRPLTVAEIFMHSSNIGSAKMALEAGVEAHRKMIADLGLMARLETELPERGRPLTPDPWRDVNTATIAFGHGIAVTPLHLAAAVGALVNGGVYLQPTFLKNRGGAPAAGRRVVSERTSEQIRGLMRLVVAEGTGKRAEVEGYWVGGKTATAEKPSARGYDRSRLISSFVGVFPGHEPKYLVLVSLDEPKGDAQTQGFATAGWTAAPLAGAVIGRLGPLLGVRPVRPPESEAVSAEGAALARALAWDASLR